jgi:hypothetical protein
MPNITAKKIAFSLLWAAFFFQVAHAQRAFFLAKSADSLFVAGQPTKAQRLYQEVLSRRTASPQMLLRLAAVKESEEDYPAALYYLNLYQAHYPSGAVWHKMSELASAQRLTGYPDTWRQQVGLTFRRYYNLLLQILLGTAVAAGMLLLLRRRGTAKAWWLLYGTYVLLIAVFLNVLDAPTAGMVYRPRAALMAGPSAAANWLTTAAAGDRLLIQGKEDIWYRVFWRGRTAYIRQQDILIIN